MELGWFKKWNAWWCTSIQHASMHHKRWTDFSDFFWNASHFKWLNVLQIFFFNLVKCKVHFFINKQEILTSLHLRSFRQFQNLSEETWSRAAENFIKLCFVAFMSNKSKNCFILISIIFSYSEIIAISILHCVVWKFWQQMLKSQWT